MRLSPRSGLWACELNRAEALRNYEESYTYDRAGNITELDHAATGNAWTRAFSYAADSNRLDEVTVGSATDSYSHDVHGNLTAMPHMPTTTGPDIQGMLWSHGDRQERARKRAGAGTYFIYFQYGSNGRRVRKVRELDTRPLEAAHQGSTGGRLALHRRMRRFPMKMHEVQRQQLIADPRTRVR